MCASVNASPRQALWTINQRRKCHRPRRRGCRQADTAVYSSFHDIFGRLAVGQEPVPVTKDPLGRVLVDWMQQLGLPPQKVMAASLPGSGRGLVAAAHIRAGEKLLFVPGEQTLTASAAAQQSALAPLLALAPLPSWSVLALWLAEARAAGGAHPWAPYMALLPERPGSVLEWSESQVDWLRGSPLHSAACSIRSAAERSWQELEPLLAEAAARGLVPVGALGREEVYWAFGILLSRLVRLQGLGDTEALVPWADLLNHDCQAGCHLDWDTASSAVVLQVDRAYRRGEEVLISYGPRTSGQLLLSYGFLPSPGTNPHDAYLLEVPALAASEAGSPGSSSTSSRRLGRDSSARTSNRSTSNRSSSINKRSKDKQRGSVGSGMDGSSSSSQEAVCVQAPADAEWRLAALAQHGYEGHSTAFPLRLDAVPEELIRYAAFAATPVGSAEQALVLAAQVFAKGQLPLGGRQAALEMVVRRCQGALGQYPSSLEEDCRELKQLEQAQQQALNSGTSDSVGQSEGGSAGGGQGRDAAVTELQRRKQVLQVLIGERRVLHRAVFLLQQELRQGRRDGR